MGRTLVTGGTGFIGSEIVNLLAARDGEQPVVLDRFPRRDVLGDLGERVPVLEGDIRDPEFIRSAIEKYHVDRIIHTASLLQEQCQRDPIAAINVNVRGTGNVLEAARRTDVKRVVFSSSIAVYGYSKYSPVDEDHPCRPETVYGASKLFCECLGANYLKLFGLSFMALRYGLVYGPGESGSAGMARDFQQFLAACLLKKSAALKGANQQWPYLYVKDAARAAVLACFADSPGHQVFNVAGQSHTLYQLADIIKRFEPTVRIELDPEPNPNLLVDGFLDISRARAELKFEPEYSLERGVTECISQLRR